jgi:hypothetical protein
MPRLATRTTVRVGHTANNTASAAEWRLDSWLEQSSHCE